MLTPEQVRQSPARESQDLLREIPAVELPRTSSLVGGTAQIVSIRGVDEGRTAVLADGIPINDAWGEWIDWGRVPKAMLDHVEVLEGGQSNLYGNGAMGGVISYFTRPLSPGAMQMQVDGGSRDARHGYLAAGLPAFGAFTATLSGDYQEGGGYNMINDPLAGSIDNVSQVIQRNAFGRINYAPSSTLSAFVGGHLFGDSRNTGTPLSFANRDQRDVSGGLDWGQASTGLLGIRAWDGRQVETQRSTAFRSPATRSAEDSSLHAAIPSHDWGGSAQLVEVDVGRAPVVQRRWRFPPLSGRLQRDRLQHDRLRDCCGDVRHDRTHRLVGWQPEPERRVRAGDPCSVYAADASSSARAAIAGTTTTAMQSTTRRRRRRSTARATATAARTRSRRASAFAIRSTRRLRCARRTIARSARRTSPSCIASR